MPLYWTPPLVATALAPEVRAAVVERYARLPIEPSRRVAALRHFEHTLGVTFDLWEIAIVRNGMPVRNDAPAQR